VSRPVTVFVIASLAFAVVAPVARAAVETGAAPAPVELTLEQALAQARKRNHSLAVDRARLEQAQTNIESAWAALFPTVTAQGKYTHNDYPDGHVTIPFGSPNGVSKVFLAQEQLDGAINASVPLLAPAAYPALEAVKSGVRSAEANYQASEDQVLFSVAQSFYVAGISDELVVARHSNVDVARATLDNARTRFAAGTVTKVDVDRAELALMRAEQQEREAITSRDQAYQAVSTLIQFEGAFHVSIPPPAPPLKIDAESLSMALKLRPEFRALEESARSSEQTRKAYLWRWAPTLSAFGYARAFNYVNFAGNEHTWGVGAQLDWVLYDGGTRDAQRHLATAQADQAFAQSAVLRDNIADDLVNGSRTLATKQKALETAERSVGLAQETLDLVRVQYEAGSVTQVDLLQAQDSLVSVRQSLAQAHYDVSIADLALRRTVGTFPPK
jgi:outer membrane protein TolC